MEPEVYGTPYAYPQVGSPEAGVVQSALTTRQAATPMTPEELEGMRWNNWAQSNNFEVQDPRVQQQLVKMYNDNVLPYVASATGGNVDVYRQQFAANYPLVAQLIGRELSDVEGRMADAEMLGLDASAATMFGATGNLPKPDEDPFAKAQATNAARQTTLDQVDAEFPGVLTDDQRIAYRLTGDPTKLEPKNAAKAAEDANKMRATDEKIIRGIDATITNVGHAMRSVDNILGTLGYSVGADSALSGEGRGRFSAPASGPLSERVAQNVPLQTDAATLRGYLNTLKASAVFDTLQELRANSTNGSSGLGQVTNVEIGLLASRIAALDPANLSEEQLAEEVRYFHENLTQVRTDLDNRRNLELSNYNTVYGVPFQSAPNTPQLPPSAPAAVPSAPAAVPSAPAAVPSTPAPAPTPDPAAPAAPANAPATAPRRIEITPEQAAIIFGGVQ